MKTKLKWILLPLALLFALCGQVHAKSKIKTHYNKRFFNAVKYEKLSPKTLEQIRQAYIKFSIEIEKSYAKTSSIDSSLEMQKMLEFIFLDSAHAATVSCPYGGITCAGSSVIGGRCASVWNKSSPQEFQDCYRNDVYGKSSCTDYNKQFACSTSLYGTVNGKGICVDRNSNHMHSDACLEASRSAVGQDGYSAGSLTRTEARAAVERTVDYCRGITDPDRRVAASCSVAQDSIGDAVIRQAAEENRTAATKIDEQIADLRRYRTPQTEKIAELEAQRNKHLALASDADKALAGDASVDRRSLIERTDVAQGDTARLHQGLAYDLESERLKGEDGDPLVGANGLAGYEQAGVCGANAKKINRPDAKGTCVCNDGGKEFAARADGRNDCPIATASGALCPANSIPLEGDKCRCNIGDQTPFQAGVDRTCSNDGQVPADEVAAAPGCGTGTLLDSGDNAGKCECPGKDGAEPSYKSPAGANTCTDQAAEVADTSTKTAADLCKEQDPKASATQPTEGQAHECFCGTGEERISWSVAEGKPEDKSCPAAPANPEVEENANQNGNGAGQCNTADYAADLNALQTQANAQPKFMEGAEELEEARINYQGTSPFESCQQMSASSWDKVAGTAGSALRLKFIQLYRTIRGTDQESGSQAAGVNAFVTEYKARWQAYHGVAFSAGGSLAPPTNEQLGKVISNPAQNGAGTLDTYKQNLLQAGGDLQSAINSVVREAQQVRDEYKKCASVAAMTKWTDYGDEEQTTPDQEATSIDGSITCRTSGAETQDFGECKAGILAYNAAMVANQGMDIYDQVDYADFQMEQQLASMQNANSGANADFTLALKQQKASLEKQVEALQRRAVFDGVKMGVFFAVRANMPTEGDLIKECTSNIGCSTNVADSYYQQLIAVLRFELREFLPAHQDGREMVYGGTGASAAPAADASGSGAGDATVADETTTDGAVTDEASSDATGGLKVPLGSILAVAPGSNPVQLSSEAIVSIVSTSTGTATRNSALIQSNSSKTISLPALGSTDQSEQFDEMNGENMCSEVMHSDPGYALIENEEARDKMMQELLKATADLATHLLQMNILKKQIARIQDAINGIQNFEPIPLTYTGEDLLATLCAPEAFPTHPDCLNLDPTRTFGFPDQTFNINGPDAVGTNGGALADTSGNSDATAVGNSDPTNRVRNRARPVASTSKGGNGGLNVAGGSGGLKGGGGLGGGGGGGGGGGASAPNNGGGGGAAPKNNGSSARKAVGYTGSSAGSLAFGRGTGSSKSKKKSKNPFANFKKKNNSGGVLNFRNPAGIGSKSSNLFQMISNGYSRAVKNDQLLKYTAKKK